MRRDGEPSVVDVVVAVARIRRRVQVRRSRAGAVGHGLLGAGGHGPGCSRTQSRHCAEKAAPPQPDGIQRTEAHGFTAATSGARAALRPRTRTLTAETPQSSASGSIPSTKLPVHSLTTPTTFTITAPPIRLEIALMPARPAASVPADSQLAESAQNGPLKA